MAISRRKFMTSTSAYSLALSRAASRLTAPRPQNMRLAASIASSSSNPADCVREFLEKLTYKREEVETFLNPREPNWSKFDRELGYLQPVRSVERRSGPNPNCSCLRCRSDVSFGASAKSNMEIPS